MQKINEVKNRTFDEERSLYNFSFGVLDGCVFSGPADGESPLKEARNIEVKNCLFDLRYAFWHVNNANVKDVRFSNTARAPFWYCKNISLLNIQSDSVKVFRECKNVAITNSSFNSEEPFWKCNHLLVKNSKLSGFYAFFECNNVEIENVSFAGKYSFQYNRHLKIQGSNLDTKDAFWHCKNVVVRDSTIKGEYIGWYSKNMTFINCTIESHQPFCYSKNLRFINCKMPNCDLAFENSTVKGNIVGEINSIKNPIRCNLAVDKVKEIVNEHSLHKVRIKIKEPTATK